MIISCPVCAAQFRVPADVMTPGRKLRCASCKHVWTIAIDEALFEAETPDFLKQEENPPSEVPPTPESARFDEVLRQEMARGTVTEPPEASWPTPPQPRRWLPDRDTLLGYLAAGLVALVIVGIVSLFT